MRTLIALIAASFLVACTTPQPIVTTATLVGKMSGQMDDSMGTYIARLKAVRAADAQRLQTIESNAGRLRIANEGRVQILSLSGESQAVNVFRTVTAVPKDDPTALLTSVRPGIDVAAPAFNGEPLQNVAKVAAEVAEPRSAKEQLLVLFRFAATVNDDLQEGPKK